MANRHLSFSITLALAALAGIATVASPAASGADSARLAPPVRPHLLTAYHPRPTSQLNPNSDLGLNFWSAMQNRPSVQPFAVTLSSKFSSVGPGSIYTGASGQNYSGRIVAIAAHPTDANTLYIAAAGGGVWKTTNGGTSWTALTNGLPWQAMGSITIDPSNPNNVYAGTGETNNSGDSEYGIGLYKSTDAGSSWTLIQGNSGTNEFYRQMISKIVVDPNSSDTIYMAVEGGYGANSVYGPTGVYKSTDGGNTWTNTTANIANDDYPTYQQWCDLVMDPTNDKVLYAAAGDVGGSTTNGIYKTTDGGSTWTLQTGAPNNSSDSNVGRIALSISASSHNTLYASVENESTYELYNIYKTTDGTTWKALSNVPNYMGQQGWYDQIIAVNPKNPNSVFVSGCLDYSSYSDEALETTDGGTNWSDITFDASGNTPHTDFHGIAFDAGGHVVEGNDGGVWRLDDADVSALKWTDINSNLAITQFTGVALHPTNSQIAIGGSQDNGTEGFTGSTQWDLLQGGDGGFVRISQQNPDVLYHTFYYSGDGFLERSDDDGQTWTGETSGINTDDNVPGDNGDPYSLKDDVANFYPPYVLDPAKSTRLMLGTDHIYETTDSADKWTAIATPATANFNPNDAPVDALSFVGNTIYATAGGQVFYSTNDGSSWGQSAPRGASDHFKDIFVDPTTASNVYLVRDQFDNGSDTGHVFHSTNSGHSWTDITYNLPDVPTNAVKYDSANKTVYIGNDGGVYSLVPGQTSWTKLTGMPDVQVVDLEVNTADGVLAAATHGRGMYELVLSSPAGLKSVTLSPTSTQGGSAPTTANRVYWNGNAPANETVTLKSSNTAVATVPSSVTISSGSSSHAFTITTKAVTSSTNVTITATSGGVSQTATLTVTH